MLWNAPESNPSSVGLTHKMQVVLSDLAGLVTYVDTRKQYQEHTFSYDSLVSMIHNFICAT